MSSASNPFVPGMNLSVVLVMAARRAVEGEKRALLLMQVSLPLGGGGWVHCSVFYVFGIGV